MSPACAYNRNMKIRLTHGAPRSLRIQAVALVAAGMLVVMLVAQLFGYEDFAATLSGVLPINDLPLVKVLGGVLVLAELLALPYLLSMYISPLMRICSALLAVVVGSFWLFVALTNAHASNIGFFSTALKLPGGIVAAVWALMLFGAVFAVILHDSRFRHQTSTS